MDLKIVIKDWKIREKKDKSKTISGNYAVMCGASQVATSEFNGEYQSTDISIPAALIVKVEELDAEIRQVVSDNFTT